MFINETPKVVSNIDNNVQNNYSDIKPVMVPGYAAVMEQNMSEIYPEEEALDRGTVFPELHIPMGKYERTV